MTIEHIVGRFLEIEGAAAGYGPRHQVHPAGAIEARINSFMDAYPLVCRDPCYRDFQEMYAGAEIDQRIGAGAASELRGKNSVHILGFSDVALDIEELEGPVVDDDGFLLFAICGYRRHTNQDFYIYEYDFAFDVSGTRRPGVYQSISEGQESSSFTWYIDDFCSWLEDLIDKGGVYERPSSTWDSAEGNADR